MKAAHRLESLKAAILRGITIGTLNLPDPFLKTIGRSRLKPVDGRSLDLQLAALLKMDELLGDSDPSQHPPAISRKIMREKVRVVASPPRKNVQSRDFEIPGPAGAIPARYYEPDEINPASPLVMYMHGGGWALGDLDTHDSFCRLVASKSNVRVVAIDYRLAPEHPFPAAIDDCLAATAWVHANAAEIGVDPQRLAVGGDSAGGNLAACVAYGAREQGMPLVLQLLVYPVVDADFERTSYVDNAEGFLLTSDAMRFYWDLYVPDPGQRTDPLVAPIHAVDLSGLAPALIITAEFDPLRDEAEAYGEALRGAGVDATTKRYAGMIHAFFNMETEAPVAEVAAAAAEAIAALRQAFARERPT